MVKGESHIAISSRMKSNERQWSGAPVAGCREGCRVAEMEVVRKRVVRRACYYKVWRGQRGGRKEEEGRELENCAGEGVNRQY